MQRTVVAWDFDGTLGRRQGGMWSDAVCQAAAELLPGCELNPDQVRPLLQTGFPWHQPMLEHNAWKGAAGYWANLLPTLAEVFSRLGWPEQANQLAERTRRLYTDPERWQLYPDTLTALERLTAKGYQHAIVSNHVPELRQIVEHLGLASHLIALVNSAEIGFEKPHPEIYRLARAAAGNPTDLWMVGDSIEADVLGAARVGIPAILVRKRDRRAVRQAADLLEAAEMILATELR